MPKLDGEKRPEKLAPFFHYGLDLVVGGQGREALGECPFCGKELKFSVNEDTGQWQCWSCSERGNWVGFVRRLWETSDKLESDYASLARERQPILPETFIRWGVTQSMITGEWLIPGWGADCKLNGLYRWAKPFDSTKRRLQTSGEPGHQLGGVPLFDHTREVVWLCEGAWDGMAWWQTLRQTARDDDGHVREVAPDSQDCLLSECNVVAVPGCKVFKETWCELFAEKRVIIAFHNDHPRESPPGSGNFRKDGWDGAARVTASLTTAKRPPRSVEVVYWGKDGYAEEHKSGYDLRDLIVERGNCESVKYVLGKIAPVPGSWTQGKVKVGGKVVSTLQPQKCESFRDLINSWLIALKWRQGLQDVFTAMLAVALSTDQVGDQLFLQVIGEAGSAKTRLCDGMIVSPTCHALEHITGFHSGLKDGSGKEFSLIGRINKKTLITPEGDVLMASPKFAEIMSQQRRIFDGTSGATYKNSTEDKRWTGLRTPWIIAGTPALMETDQSRLGDRFLRVCIDHPSEQEKADILLKVGWSAIRSVRQASNGHCESQTEPSMTTAYKMTGGYVDWLRANSEDIIGSVRMHEEDVIGVCASLAEFAADLRARPHPDHKRDLEASKELPSRLTSQFVRMAVCIAGVTNRRFIDDEVLRIVAKMAVDTSRGKTMEMVRHLYRQGKEGSSVAAMGAWAKLSDERAKHLTLFLAQLGIIEHFTVTSRLGINKQVRWRLTSRTRRLWERTHATLERQQAVC